MTILDNLLTRSEKRDLGSFLADELYRLGYRSDKPEALKAFADEGRGGAEEEHAVEDAVADYQRTWKEDLDFLAGRAVDADGDPGPVTLQHLLNRTCPVPDRLFAADGTPMEARWPDSCKDDLTWHVDYSNFSESTFGLSRAAVEAEFAEAFADMMALFNVTTRPVGSRSEAKFQESFARLGGSTLGVHYLANNTCSPKPGQYNVMNWRSGIDYLGQVIRHEITHGLGLGHVPGQNLMNPSIVWPLGSNVRGWTERDINAVLGLGYKRRTEPLPDPKPDDPDTGRGFACRVLTTSGQIIKGNEIAELSFKIKAK